MKAALSRMWLVEGEDPCPTYLEIMQECFQVIVYPTTYKIKATNFNDKLYS